MSRRHSHIKTRQALRDRLMREHTERKRNEQRDEVFAKYKSALADAIIREMKGAGNEQREAD